MNILGSNASLSFSLMFLPPSEVSQLTWVSKEWNRAAIKHIELLVRQSIGNIERIFSVYSCSHGARLQNLVDIRNCRSVTQLNDVSSGVILKIKFLSSIINFEKVNKLIVIENIFQLNEEIKRFEKAEKCLGNVTEFGLYVLKTNGMLLEHFSAGVRGNKKAVLRATTNDGRAVRYAAEALRGNRDFMLSVVRANPYALPYIREEFQRDEEFIETASRAKGARERSVAKCVGEPWSDGAFVLAMLKGQYDAAVLTVLSRAAKQLRNDREIMLTAVQQYGKAIELASAQIVINDREILLAAVQQDGEALEKARLRLCRGNQVEYELSLQLCNDREIVLAAVQQNGLALWRVSQSLQNDREIVLAAVRQNGLALRYASDSLKNDPEIVLAAVQQDGRALDFASNKLKRNRKIVKAAVRQFPGAWELANDPIFSFYFMANGFRLYRLHRA